MSSAYKAWLRNSLDLCSLFALCTDYIGGGSNATLPLDHAKLAVLTPEEHFTLTAERAL